MRAEIREKEIDSTCRGRGERGGEENEIRDERPTQTLQDAIFDWPSITLALAFTFLLGFHKLVSSTLGYTLTLALSPRPRSRSGFGNGHRPHVTRQILCQVITEQDPPGR
jgi:hypothetical protein